MNLFINGGPITQDPSQVCDPESFLVLCFKERECLELDHTFCLLFTYVIFI